MLTAERVPYSGKVRDRYDLPDGRIALVATDRISAFDVILPTRIPDKGKVLTGLSRFWFDRTGSIVRNHLVGTDTDDAAWRGRLMLCERATVIPIEAVVRGYLSGSGWKEYRATSTVCGLSLPAGLRESDELPEPIFTPATKEPLGRHDENVSFDGAIEHIRTQLRLGKAAPELAEGIAEVVRDRAIKLYRYGAGVAAEAGILLADTKFEFGIPAGDLTPDRVILIDEVMTPDSSRFWDASTYVPGGPQASYDKQFVRDWLERQPWDKTDPGPELPPDVVHGTRTRYVEAFERITGASFDRYLAEDVIAP
jgi:phosphoribosylaminoimidazole-succinocarboxamide synthase